jgi:hypothetical protein
VYKNDGSNCVVEQGEGLLLEVEGERFCKARHRRNNKTLAISLPAEKESGARAGNNSRLK